jgi:hypothetical protein
MAKALTPIAMGRIVFVLLLLSAVCISGVDARAAGGVLGFLRRLEERVEKKTFWFYRFFGTKQEEEKVNLAQQCDYDDPNKIQFCSPVNFNPRLAVNHNPNLPFTGGVSGSKTALPSKCLEDPDDPECRKLLVGLGSQVGDGSRPGAAAASVTAIANATPRCEQEGGEVKLITEEDTVPLPSGAVSVDVESSEDGQVTFNITQLWKEDETVGWIQPVFSQGDDNDGKMVCLEDDRENEVKYMESCE